MPKILTHQSRILTDKYGILEKFGRELQSLSRREQSFWIDRAFHSWRSWGFPYPSITKEEMIREFHLLQHSDPKATLSVNVAKLSTIGLRIANSFHPQMWNVKSRGLSPIECFNINKYLRKVLQKCLHFYPNRRCWNAQCLRSVLRFYHRGRVANFRPSVAKAIYQKYSGPNSTILDFSAGFGGRLLGSLTLKRHYVGIDPAKLQVHGLLAMGSALSYISTGTYEIHENCAEDILPSIPCSRVNLVFSSPPYFDKEKYERSPRQSYLRYPEYSLWRERFLYPVIQEVYRILRPSSYFLLNVANTVDYPIADHVLNFASNFFKHCSTIKLLMHKLPHARHKTNNDQNYRWEPIFVFRKGP